MFPTTGGNILKNIALINGETINANTNAAGNPNIACKNIFAENHSISATL